MYDSTRIEKTANKMQNFKPFSPSPYVHNIHTYIHMYVSNKNPQRELGGETGFPNRVHHSIATRPIINAGCQPPH